MKVKVAQLCLTLCDPMNYTIHRILQARILEWVAFPFSRSPTLQADSLPPELLGKVLVYTKCNRLPVKSFLLKSAMMRLL